MRLLMLLAFNNLLVTLGMVLVTPYVLSFADEITLGLIASCSGVGLLLGGLCMATWGGPKKLMTGILSGLVAIGFCFFLIGVSSSPIVIGIGGFCFLFANSILVGCSQTMWQKKVPAEVQGRVFATRRMLAWSTLPLGYLLAGPLGRFFENLMVASSSPPAFLVNVMGTGPGRGLGLLFLILGTVYLSVALFAVRNPYLTHLERDLPDAPEIIVQ